MKKEREREREREKRAARERWQLERAGRRFGSRWSNSRHFEREIVDRRVGSLSWQATAATEPSHIRQSISARVGLAILKDGRGSFLVAIFSLYARISVSVTNSGGGGGGGADRVNDRHAPPRPEIIVLHNENCFRAAAHLRACPLSETRAR